VPGSSENEAIPEYSLKMVTFQPSSDTVTIIVNVSNYHHRRGGFWLPMKIGTTEEIHHNLKFAEEGDWAAISLLTGFSLFFLIFFILYPKEKIHLYFSIAVTGLALRPLFTSNFLIQEFLIPDWI